MIDLRTSKRSLEYCLILIPFFELLTLQQLADKGCFPQLCNIVMDGLSILRILISSFVLLYYPRKKPSMTFYGLLVFVLLEGLSSIINDRQYEMTSNL